MSRRVRRAHLALLALAACSRPTTEPGPGSPSPSPTSSAGPAEPGAASASAVAPPVEAPAGPAALAPLAFDPFVALKVEGRGPAIVSVPRGARGPRPVLVAAHGNYDKPEWQCESWRLIVGDRGFVLCPRGVPRRDSPPSDQRFEYASGKALEQEVDEALAALVGAFGGYVDPSAMVYTGFSLGAHMGVGIATRRPDRFPRAVLIEGGERWSAAAASAYVKGGGQRALWACGQPGCVQSSERSSALLARAGGEGRVVYAKGAGHNYAGALGREIKSAFEWLVEGDARWAAPSPP